MRKELKGAAPPLVGQQLAKLEEAIGGRDALVAALSHAPKSKDLSYLLGLIGDPQRAGESLADLCATGGITAGELIEAYKSGELNRAAALGAREVGAGLQQVVKDTMEKAAPHEGPCSYCQGLGQVTPEPTKKVPNPEPGPCEACKGAGRLLYPGDLEHKKLALDMGRMLSGKGGGVNVQVNQQVGVMVGTAGGALEKLQAATDQILYGDGLTGVDPSRSAPGAPGPEAVEAELVDGEDAPIEDTDWRGEARA